MKAFRAFYIENGERLFGYLLRKSGSAHLAADLVQDTFTRYLSQYRSRELNAALLFTIARNIFYDHMRRQRQHVELAEFPSDTATDDQEHQYIVREESRQVLAAMQQLDEEDRDILALIVSSGLTYREIAEIRGCSESAVKVRVHRARQQLRKILATEAS